MSPPFDNLINKFKSSTKNAADQMSRTAKIAKIKMDIMTLHSERAKQLQTIGDRTYNLYRDKNGIDGNILVERIRHEITQIERIDGRVRDMENQITELHAMAPSSEVVDATEVHEVSEGDNPAGKSPE